MPIEIKSRFDSQTLYTAESATSLREAVEEAVRKGANLRGADLTAADLTAADLRGAYLSGADLRQSNLRSADLPDANLTDANLTGAALRSAYLSGADLRQSDMSDANLRGADLSDTDLTGANLTGADLTDADLTGADLTGANLRSSRYGDVYLRDSCLGDAINVVRDDLWSILDKAPDEVPAVRAALIAGKIDGSIYSGDCCCLVGTIAAARGCDYEDLPGISPNPDRPAEQWFVPIEPGDAVLDAKPKDGWPSEGVFRATLALRWVDEWMNNNKEAR